ncbi:MAG TPA: hypothetical protein P5228_12095 [Bacteroidales bacterium]|nr:hypothetical protein [Bacteroidales bacterium]HRZ50073.1 hypothetical protein [Bacteroidales bacterium]
MRVTLLLLLPVLFFGVACDKVEKTPESPVLAGVHDTGMVYTAFNPPVQPVLTVDSTGYLFGCDSLDINADGAFDIIIQQQVFPHDSFTGGSSTEYPFTSLTLKNGLCVAIKKEVVPIGLGQTTTIKWVDTMLLNARIDKGPLWSEPNVSHNLWCVPPATFWGSNGPWHNLTEAERYIGLKMTTPSGEKYGWLKCYQKSRKELAFLGCAIQK